MRSVEDGTLELSDEFIDEMYFCLDCQACETACPAGVRYGELVEDARSLIADTGKDPLSVRFIKLFFLNGILSSKFRTKLAAKLLRFYQWLGLWEAFERTNLLSIISKNIQQKHSLLPHIAEEFFDETVAEVIPPQGSKRGTVAFLSGCIMNVAFPDIHHDAVAVLAKNGYEVIIPKIQVCCGSLHGHHGETEVAKNLARENLDVFDKFIFDALVVDSAGCGAFLKEYGKLFADDEQYRTKAEQLSKKTKDITEFLADLHDPFKGYEPSQGLKRITYHEACHLVHTQKISQQPRKLLQSIPGIEMTELPEATWCCGSAGVYNVVRSDDSIKLLERKMKNIESTRADIVVTANPGCHLQLQYGIRKYGLKMEVMHPVSLMNQAYKS